VRIAALALCAIVAATAAATASAATLGVDGSTVRLDASADNPGDAELSVDFEPLDAGFFFTAQGQAGAGCQQRATTAACPQAGIAVVEIRGPRAAGAQLYLSGLRASQGTAPAVTGVVDAGSRDDVIDTVNTIADTISCGAGMDIFRADFRDSVQADCETSSDDNVRARLLPGSDVQARAAKKLGKGIESRPYGVDFKVTCPGSAPDDSCGGKLDVFLAEPSLPGGRRFFGNATYAIARGQTRPVKVSVGFGASDGETAASYRQQVAAIRSALKKRGRARMRAQVRSGSSRFQHSFSVTSIRR
jgi:hypothetical protein